MRASSRTSLNYTRIHNANLTYEKLVAHSRKEIIPEDIGFQILIDTWSKSLKFSIPEDPGTRKFSLFLRRSMNAMNTETYSVGSMDPCSIDDSLSWELCKTVCKLLLKKKKRKRRKKKKKEKRK